jgi:hypothetical protein
VTSGDGESNGTGLMTMISGVGEGEQLLKKSLLRQAVGDGLWGSWHPWPICGVHVGFTLAAGDEALAARGAGGVVKKRSAVSGGIASAAAVLSRRRPGRLISLLAM